ncbi:MAG: asparagine synthetase B [Geobacter sp.]|nr:MAG: asparagine synthetase B [Geobacter sp.]
MQTMCNAMPRCKNTASKIWQDGVAGLGQTIYDKTRQKIMQYKDTNSNFVLTTICRVDNRAELGNLLQISETDVVRFPDSEFILRAYLQWGQECATRILGDWAFAIWHPNEQKLFLARDHHGNTSLYYFRDKNLFAFASSKDAILSLKNISTPKLNELYLSQILTGWQAYHGERTIYEQIYRIPPSHTLSVTNSQLINHQYWYLKSTPELHLSKRNDYVEAFLSIFDEAVRCRLRSTTNSTSNYNDIAVQLSAGLDSSAVTVTAEKLLRSEQRKVVAFTAAPAYDSRKFVHSSNGAIGDETLLAKKCSIFANSLRHITIKAEAISPIQSIRTALDIHKEPIFGAANYFWLSELRKAVHDMGYRILLTGQNGNPGMSWTGVVSSQPLNVQLSILGWQKWFLLKFYHARQSLFHTIKSNSIVLSFWHNYFEQRIIRRYSAININFARRLKLLEQMTCSSNQRPPLTILDQRRILQPGRSMTGCLHAEMGAAYDLEIRDPTADVRVLTFSFSIPDHIFIDPKTGIDRWLIREAMKDRLPDEVRLNRRFGVQSADIVPRLRACAPDVEKALKELSLGPASEYVDVPHMLQSWRIIQSQDTPEASLLARAVVCRGIMVGLFVNWFYQ